MAGDAVKRQPCCSLFLAPLVPPRSLHLHFYHHHHPHHHLLHHHHHHHHHPPHHHVRASFARRGLPDGHPAYAFAQPPTADFIKPDLARTPTALRLVTDFAERTYVEYVLPLLPADATRRCRALANPWAYADAAAAALQDSATGAALAFPRHPAGPARARELATDALTRGITLQKLVLENESSPKARMLLGGAPFDFGDDVKAATRGLVGDLGANRQF